MTKRTTTIKQLIEGTVKKALQDLEDKRELYVFDYDDTLVSLEYEWGIRTLETDEVRQVRDGAYRPVGPDERYEVLDYFEIPHYTQLSKLKRVVNELGPESAAVLTARGPLELIDVKDFLGRHGLGEVHIQAVGNRIYQKGLDADYARRKALWVEDQIKQRKLTRVEFWDDHPYNCSAIDGLVDKYYPECVIVVH